MTEEQLWRDVDEMIGDALLPGDDALEAALAESAAAGLPAINVTPQQGKFLALLVSTLKARRVLEIGTLGGYSSIWMARALLPGGTLTTLEVDPRHAEVARQNLDRAGLSGRVEVLVGAALRTLPSLEQDRPRAFQLIFIDADKANNAEYFASALRLVAPGGLIVVDNVVRGGAIADAANSEPGVLGVRRLFEVMRSAPGVESTALQTVGSKGYDGFTLSWVP